MGQTHDAPTELIAGKTVDEALHIGGSDLSAALGRMQATVMIVSSLITLDYAFAM
jgi:hypothetical protein